MEWRIDGSRPIWMQLSEQLTERIIKGEYPPGEKLPSVRELASQAGVNPNTMQRALSQLDSEGLTETNRTVGRTVTCDSTALEKIKNTVAREKIRNFLISMESLGISRESMIEIMKGEVD